MSYFALLANSCWGIHTTLWSEDQPSSFALFEYLEQLALSVNWTKLRFMTLNHFLFCYHISFIYSFIYFPNLHSCCSLIRGPTLIICSVWVLARLCKLNKASFYDSKPFICLLQYFFYLFIFHLWLHAVLWSEAKSSSSALFEYLPPSANWTELGFLNLSHFIFLL